MKTKKVLSGLLFTLLGLGVVGINENPFTAETEVSGKSYSEFNKIGDITISEARIYDPNWGNGSTFLWLKLDGSDYPTSYNSSSDMIQLSASNLPFDLEVNSYIKELDAAGNFENSTLTVWESYANQNTYCPYFSIGLAASFLASDSAVILKEGFKIPSFSLLKNDTTSPTYGYYTVSKSYKLTNPNPGIIPGVNDRPIWEAEEYDISTSNIEGVETWVTSDNQQALTFKVGCFDLDYPDVNGTPACSFSSVVNDLSTITNAKTKILAYDSSDNLIDFTIDDIVINQWTYHPYISILSSSWKNAVRIIVKEGLNLPSYARFQGLTTNAYYDGFTMKKTKSFVICDNPSTTTGSKNIWNVVDSSKSLGEISIKSLKSHNVYGNANEMFFVTFYEQTDFTNAAQLKWSKGRYSLLSNFSSKVEFYRSNNSKMDTNVIDVYYTWNEQGSLGFMNAGCGDAVKVIFKKGFKIPSYAYYMDTVEDENYGYYELAFDYEFTIQENHKHTSGSVNNWTLPKCSIEFYDEQNTILTGLYSNVVAEVNSWYSLPLPPEKAGFTGEWTVTSPSGISINSNNQIRIPSDENTTVKLKAQYSIKPSKLGDLTIKSVKSHHCYDDNNKNEMTVLEFNESVYFGSEALKWDAGKYSLLENFATNVEFYNQEGYKLSPNLIDAYYNYGASNSFAFMNAGSQDGVKVIFKAGFIIPAIGNYENNNQSDSFGYYTIKEDTTFVIDGAASHTQNTWANWYLPECNIEFYDENDNRLTGPQYPTKADCGSELTLPNVVSKTGHTGSWVVTSPSNVPVTNGKITVPNTLETIKIKMSYTVNQYHLSFNVGGFDDKIITFGTAIGELPSVPAETGKDGCWKVDGVEITPTTIWSFESNKTAVASYSDSVLTVTFNSNGGSEVDNQTVIYNHCIENLPTPTKSGFAFLGWYSDEALTTKFTNETPVTSNITVYAKWGVVYTVTFFTDGGSLVESQTVVEGETASRPEFDPTKTGYTFDKWTVNGEEFDFDTPITGNITISASWIKDATDENTEEKGCGSSLVGISSLFIASIGALSVLNLIKKKED